VRRRRQEVKTPLLLLLGSPWSADEGERARVSRLVRYTAVPSASETPPAVKATCGPTRREKGGGGGGDGGTELANRAGRRRKGDRKGAEARSMVCREQAAAR